VLKGLFGDDTLKGLGGADALYGGGDNDTLKGGDGIDTASYADSDDGVFVSIIGGTALGRRRRGRYVESRTSPARIITMNSKATMASMCCEALPATMSLRAAAGPTP
jgi:hypothetical protein